MTGPPLWHGYKHCRWKNFAENCMKMKEFGPRGDARPWRPLGSATVLDCTLLAPPAGQFWLERFPKDMYKSQGKWGYFQAIRESFCKRLATGSVEAHFLLFKLSPASGLVIMTFYILNFGSCWLVSWHILPLGQSSFIFSSCYSFRLLKHRMVENSLAPKYKLPPWLPSWQQYSKLAHPASRALNSDWSVNSCIMVVYEKLFSIMLYTEVFDWI